MNVGDWPEIGRHLIHEWGDWGQCQRQKQTGNKSGHGINVTNKAHLQIKVFSKGKIFH